jgi:hypothetical protein
MTGAPRAGEGGTVGSGVSSLDRTAMFLYVCASEVAINAPICTKMVQYQKGRFIICLSFMPIVDATCSRLKPVENSVDEAPENPDFVGLQLRSAFAQRNAYLTKSLILQS